MRGCVAFSALALAAVLLVGCGRFASDEREPWRLAAEEACLRAQQVPATAYMSRLSEIDGPGSCGITHPFRAQAFLGGDVRLASGLTLACPIIPEIDRWLAETVRPAAELHLGQSVVGLRAGSYSCRPRNNQSGARASEHSYGNALDVFAFRLADGREVTVGRGWRGETDEQHFLREVFAGACRSFTTVLGPGADAFHHDHLHLDLARHDPQGRRRVCKPLIKFEPHLDPDRVASRTAPQPRPRPGQDDETTAPPPRRLPAASEPLPISPPASRRSAAAEPLPLQPHLAGRRPD